MGAAPEVTDPTAHALRVYVGAFADELVRAGVTDVCICPGSRSTPLAIVLKQQPGLRTWMHYDERSAAYYALGMARGYHRPVAIVATSGTAVVNFAPAVAEARFGAVPLLVLTADRPAELRGIGSTQTIDQNRLYGSNAKWSEEMLLPEATPAAERYVRAIADRAVATALSAPCGPVHLNFPFREPLVPAPPDANATSPAGLPPAVSVTPTANRPTVEELAPIAAQVLDARRGLVVCGPQDYPAFPGAALRLAEAAGYPLLADVLSQTRCGLGDGHVIDNFDAFLRDAATAEGLAPDLVLRFGATPVSKPLSQYLERNAGVAQIVVSDEGTWTDPQQTASAMVRADATAFCETLTAALQSRIEPDLGWLNRWRAARDATAASTEASLRNEAQLSEPSVFQRLPALLPDEAIVFAGNSMPVRDLDSFVARDEKALRFLANRGASGIDGVTSTALGVAAATGKPVVLTIGDLSFYHDMNGLLAARRYGDELNLTIVLINNDGGGIFSFLPQQTEVPDVFEDLFGTPHGLDFRHAAALYGLDYTLAQSPADFDAAVSASVSRRGVSIVEVQTQRDENLSYHGLIWRNVREALAAARS